LRHECRKYESYRLGDLCDGVGWNLKALFLWEYLHPS
jgi:hypothetical protein